MSPAIAIAAHLQRLLSLQSTFSATAIAAIHVSAIAIAAVFSDCYRCSSRFENHSQVHRNIMHACSSAQAFCNSPLKHHGHGG